MEVLVKNDYLMWRWNVSTHCMAVPFSFLSRGYRESLHQKNYYSLLLLIGNSDI